jgi:hypothetical protein
MVPPTYPLEPVGTCHTCLRTPDFVYQNQQPQYLQQYFA